MFINLTVYTLFNNLILKNTHTHTPNPNKTSANQEHGIQNSISNGVFKDQKPLGCFGSFKDQKRRKQRYKVIPRDQKPKILDIVKADEYLEQSMKESTTNPFPNAREKPEVPPLSVKRRKKVTFDTNVTTYEPIQVYDSTESLLEKNKKGETLPKSEPDVYSNNALLVVSSMPDYRYGNCIESDNEIDDLDHEDYDFDEDDYDLDDEKCYDDNVDDGVAVSSIEFNKNAPDRNGYILSVLNPVENLSQWKALKSKGTTRKPLNFNGKKEFSPELENLIQETVVDASLSNWLISLQNTTNNKRVALYNSNNNTEVKRTSSSEFKG